MEIYVKMVSGKIIVLEVETSDTIRKVKAMIKQKTGIPPEQQRFVSIKQHIKETLHYFSSILKFLDDGNQVENYRTLANYNIQNFAILNFVHLPHGMEIYVNMAGKI